MELEKENQTLDSNRLQKNVKKSTLLWVVLGIFTVLFLSGSFYYLNKSNKGMDIQQTKNEKLDEKNYISLPVPGDLILFTLVQDGKKEQYLLNINGLNVNAKILVNGISAFSEDLDASVSIPALPITPFMTNGDNTVEITVTALPSEYKNNNCSFNFGYVDLEKSNDITYNKKFECTEILKNKGTESFVYNIKTKLSFISPWLKGKKFENSETTKKQLLDKYREMQNIFVSNDTEKIKFFLKYKFEMDSKWMNEPKEEVEKDYIKSVTSELKNPNIKLIPILENHSNDIKLELSKDNLLARLIVEDNGSVLPPIMWWNKEDETTLTYPLWFMMTQDNYIIPII